MGKIGIGITTRNRPSELQRCINALSWYSHVDMKLVVVDDASDKPYFKSNHYFEKNVGIAVAKNKCLELLDDCEHIFLFDDDTHPIAPNWWVPYIESGEPHLMYVFENFATGRKLNDTAKIYEDDKIVAYSHARGCMLYYHSSVLQHVGGMDKAFGTWGWDHVSLSDRIYNAGLTRFRYADAKGSNGLFYSADEHQAAMSTCVGRDRQIQIQRNKPIYESKYNSSEYVPYKEGAERKGHNKAASYNEVLTCYFTKYPDPQGRNFVSDLSPCNALLQSLNDKECCTTIFFDTGWPLNGLEEFKEAPAWFEETECKINPYFQRWITYREWLIEHRNELDFVWCVDATDVEMLRDPFPHMEKGKLYVGDEPDRLSSVWLRKHHPELAPFFVRNQRETLLNAGLVGGDVETVLEYTARMIDVYQKLEHERQLMKRKGPGLTDMGAHNYVCYTYFKDRIVHGKQVNTQFKAYEADNGVSWWKHK